MGPCGEEALRQSAALQSPWSGSVPGAVQVGRGRRAGWTEPGEGKGREGGVTEHCKDFDFGGSQWKVLSRGLTRSCSPARSGCCVKNRVPKGKSGNGEMIRKGVQQSG